MRKILPLLLGLSLSNSFASEITIGLVEVSQRAYIDENGHAQGSSVEILNSIVSESGFTPVNEVLPFPRVLKKLENGDVDVSLLVLNDTVRQYAKPISALQQVNFVLVGRQDLSLTSLDDIHGKSVGILRRAPLPKTLLEPLPVTIYESSQYTQLIEMLKRNRIDAILGPAYNIDYAMKQLNYDSDLLGKRLIVKQLDLYFVYSKQLKDKDAIASFSQAIDHLKSTNHFQSIVNKYH